MQFIDYLKKLIDKYHNICIIKYKLSHNKTTDNSKQRDSV